MIQKTVVTKFLTAAWCMLLLAGFAQGAPTELEAGQAEVVLKVENMT